MISIKKKAVRLMLMAFFVVGGVAYAQQQQMMQQQQQPKKDYSTEEIDLFADAVVQALPVQQEGEQEVIAEIEKQGMELN